MIELLDEIEKELIELQETAKFLAGRNINVITASYSNASYSTIKSELLLILQQLDPFGNELIQLVNQLPSKLKLGNNIDHGLILGYVNSTLSLVKKIKSGKIQTSPKFSKPIKYSTKIFIVHGHDTSMLSDVNSFILSIGLTPIVLHEQPNKGRTIIEKFIDYSDVGFAIILLSPDDITIENKIETYRARQNVIFEMGFFIGKLGRESVVTLYKDPVQIPSDYLGVLYVPYNESRSWENHLVKEMKEAGFNNHQIEYKKLI